MAKLPTLAEQIQLDAGLKPVTPSHAQGEPPALGLQHVPFHLGEHGADLVHERPERTRGGLAVRGPSGPQEQQENRQ